MKLNQQIRGWTNYHQSVSASEAFAHLDYVLYELLWHWAKRRHPKKGKRWISTKYWHHKGNRSWVFSTEEHELIRVDHTPIVRHRKVSTAKNPYIDAEYFTQKKFNQGMARLSGRFKLIWKIRVESATIAECHSVFTTKGKSFIKFLNQKVARTSYPTWHMFTQNVSVFMWRAARKSDEMLEPYDGKAIMYGS